MKAKSDSQPGPRLLEQAFLRIFRAYFRPVLTVQRKRKRKAFSFSFSFFSGACPHSQQFTIYKKGIEIQNFVFQFLFKSLKIVWCTEHAEEAYYTLYILWYILQVLSRAYGMVLIEDSIYVSLYIDIIHFTLKRNNRQLFTKLCMNLLSNPTSLLHCFNVQTGVIDPVRYLLYQRHQNDESNKAMEELLAESEEKPKRQSAIHLWSSLCHIEEACLEFFTIVGFVEVRNKMCCT